jgi:hypothetical protein
LHQGPAGRGPQGSYRGRPAQACRSPGDVHGQRHRDGDRPDINMD